MREGITFQRQQVWPIMTSTLRKDTNTTTSIQSGKNRIIYCGLIHVRGNLKFRAFEIAQVFTRDVASEFTVGRDVFPSGKLEERILALERFLQHQLLRAMNLGNGRTVRGPIDSGKSNGALLFKSGAFEVRPHAAHQGRLIDGVGEVYRTLAGLQVIHCSGHGHGPDASGQQTNELALERLLCDEP